MSKYLPWFRVKRAAEEDPEITIEELLTHSSGLPREAGSHWTTFDFPTTEELRALMAERQAPFSPEVRWKYSNLAYSVAGLVVEAVSGQRWADYVQQHIYAPLGMTSSSVDANVAGLATGYNRLLPDNTRATNPFIDAKGMAAATGITSTVDDMAKFASAQFRTGRRGGANILSTGSLREMHRVRVLESNWTQGNAIGFAVRRERDKVYVSHGGSYPGYQTQTMLYPEGKVAVIVLTNADDANPGGIATQLMNTVGEAVARATAPKPESTTTSWDPVVGALRRPLPWPRRRVAGDRAQQATGHHHAQRAESRQPGAPRAHRQRSVPLHRAHGRRTGGRGRAVRGREWPGRAHVYRRRLRGACAVIAGWWRRLAAALPAATLAVMAGGTLLAQGPTWDYDLAIGDADRLAVQLTEVTAKGYRCARVARPDGGVVPQHVSILMVRPRQSGAVPRVSDIRVEVGWADDGVERFARFVRFERMLNTWAERGYELCGFTMAGSSQLRQRGFGLVAVLERLERRPPSGVSYRVVRTQRREDWPLVEAVAAEGLTLTHMVARPGPTTDLTYDNFYLFEKRPGTERPVTYRLDRAASEFELEQRLERAAKDGYRADTMWPGRDAITLLLSRPVEGAWEGRREYRGGRVEQRPHQPAHRSVDPLRALQGQPLCVLRQTRGHAGFRQRRHDRRPPPPAGTPEQRRARAARPDQRGRRPRLLAGRFRGAAARARQRAAGGHRGDGAAEAVTSVPMPI